MISSATYIQREQEVITKLAHPTTNVNSMEAEELQFLLKVTVIGWISDIFNDWLVSWYRIYCS